MDIEKTDNRTTFGRKRDNNRLWFWRNQTKKKDGIKILGFLCLKYN